MSGIVMLMFGRFLSSSLPVWTPVLVSFALCVLTFFLVDQTSTFVATSCELFAYSTFHFSLAASLFVNKTRRRFWIPFACTLWIYLFIQANYIAPICWYLGPFSYLSKYHPSAKSSEITAIALCSVAFASCVAFSWAMAMTNWEKSPFAPRK